MLDIKEELTHILEQYPYYIHVGAERTTTLEGDYDLLPTFYKTLEDAYSAAMTSLNYKWITYTSQAPELNKLYYISNGKKLVECFVNDMTRSLEVGTVWSSPDQGIIYKCHIGTGIPDYMIDILTTSTSDSKNIVVSTINGYFTDTELYFHTLSKNFIIAFYKNKYRVYCNNAISKNKSFKTLEQAIEYCTGHILQNTELGNLKFMLIFEGGALTRVEDYCDEKPIGLIKSGCKI